MNPKTCPKCGTSKIRIKDEYDAGRVHGGTVQCLKSGRDWTFEVVLTDEQCKARLEAKLAAKNRQHTKKRHSGCCKNESGKRNWKRK